MQINLNCDTGGQGCWNEPAIEAYAKKIAEREEFYGNNACVKMEIGNVACNGCGLGGACGAVLTETTIAWTDGAVTSPTQLLGLPPVRSPLLADETTRLIEGFHRHPAGGSKAAKTARILGTVAYAILYGVSRNTSDTIVPEA